MELLATKTVDADWNAPELIGEFDVLWTVGVVPDTQLLLVIEETAELVENCEGGTITAGQLTLINLDTATRLVVETDLDVTHSQVHLGPRNQLASIVGCDANAWLQAVGSIDADGTVSVREVGEDFEQRVTAGNHAGVSVTWTADGEVLFVNSTRVDADTGEKLDPSAGGLGTWTFAELADGTRLIAETSQDPAFPPFWVVEPDAQAVDVTAGPPEFSAQAGYPAVQVQIGTGGQRAYATFENWDDDTIWTAIISNKDVKQVRGRAWPSPSGSQLLVSDRSGTDRNSPADWMVVDLETGTRMLVPVPVDQGDNWVNVMWGATDNQLLITASDLQYETTPPTTIWRLSTP